MKFYDKDNKRLLVFQEEATPSYWDRHWRSVDINGMTIKRGADRIVKKTSKRFLFLGAKILEGGCGQGQNVYGLNALGFDCYGVDFAKETIAQIKRVLPELKIFAEDLQHLHFDNNFFDACWLLGVIEHNINGYEGIVKEARRILKSGGYLFLTFPQMSFLRRCKAFFGLYPFWQEKQKEEKKDSFYEFIFSSAIVQKKICNFGFKLIHQEPFDAIKGIKDECSLFRVCLSRIYQRQDKATKIFRYAFSKMLSPLAGHAKLMVFQKI